MSRSTSPPPSAAPGGPPRAERPAVLARLEAGRRHVIEASAGTGKTYTIEHLVLDAVLAGTDLGRVLVVTFTDRAAAELRARVRGLLWRSLAQAEGTGDNREERPSDDARAWWTLDDTARERLRRALAKVDGAAISTIHAFCQRLLTENAFAHRRLFTQELADGEELFSAVLKDALRTTLSVDPHLRALVLQSARPGGVEEDDGVDQLARRLFKAVRFRGRLEPVLGEEALGAALAALPRELPSAEAVAAAHGNSKSRKKILRTFGPLLGMLQRARELEGVPRLAELASIWNGSGTDGKGESATDYAQETLERPKVAAMPWAGPLRAAVATVVQTVPPPETLLVHLVAPRLREALRTAKDERGLFDFDDLLEFVDESLRGPSGPSLVAALRQRFELVLIDEFQDTDPVQWSIFRTLFVDGDAPTRFFVIGDPKQAIYGFRSADVETYLTARETLLGTSDPAELEARVVPLTRNFRSSARMIAAYNLILSQTPAAGQPVFRSDSRIAYGPKAEVSCGATTVRLEDAGGRELPPVGIVRIPIAGRGERALVVPMARFVAAEVERLLAPGGPRLIERGGSPRGRALRASDVFVLTRTGSNAALVAEALGARGLPFAFYKQEGLFERPEVAELSDVLAAVCEPFDAERRVRAWLGLFFELGPVEAERARELPPEHPLFATLIAWSELAARRDFPQLFSALVNDSGLRRRAAFAPAEEAGVAGVLRVLDLLALEARRRHATLPELVTLLETWRAGLARPAGAEADHQPLATDRPAIQLMTMHASKGLEAPVVFLCGSAPSGGRDDLLRYRRGRQRCAWLRPAPEEVKQLAKDERAGEDERLLYVALTRAKVRLYLPHFVAEASKRPNLEGALGVLDARLHHLATEPPRPELFEEHLASPESDDEGERVAAGEGSSSGVGSARGVGSVGVGSVGVGSVGVGSVAVGSVGVGSVAGGSVAGGDDGIEATAAALPVEPGAGAEAARQALLRASRGHIVSSYTQLAHGAARTHAEPPPLLEVTRDEATSEHSGFGEAEAPPSGTRRAPAPDELASSNVVGSFLHDALERLELAKVRRHGSAEELERSAPARELVEALADAAGIPARQRAHAYRLLFSALRTPLPLGSSVAPLCVADLPRVAREVEFLFPIPEPGHALLGAALRDEARPFELRRGAVKGFIDLLFEAGGRVYFADWKSNVVDDPSPTGLRRLVESEFHWQIVVYTVAVLRLLGLRDEAAYERRFGGFHYLFLRELERTPPGGAALGVHFDRPSWAEARRFERLLLEHDYGLDPAPALIDAGAALP